MNKLSLSQPRLAYQILSSITPYYCQGELNGAPITCEKTESKPDPRTFTIWSDPDNILSVAAPTDWQDATVVDWVFKDQSIGLVLMASPNLAGFDGGWTDPGVSVWASSMLSQGSHEEVLQTFADQGNSCTRTGPYEYKNAQFSGVYYVWQECNGNSNTSLFTLSLAPRQADDLKVLVQIQLVDGPNDDLVNAIIESVKLLKRPPTPQQVIAEAVVKGLNLRSGPGTTYSVLGNLTLGEQVLVLAQVNNCQWLRVVTENRQEGYVSGAAKFVTLNTACAQIPKE